MTGLFFRVILELRIGNWRSTKATNSYIEATAFLLSTHEKIEHQNRDNKSMFLTSITITHLICDQRNSQWQIELSSGRIMLSQFYQPIYNHFLGGHGHLAHGIICQCMYFVLAIIFRIKCLLISSVFAQANIKYRLF